MKKINLVILGCGKQGKTVLSRYESLYRRLKLVGVELNIFALIDSNKSTIVLVNDEVINPVNSRIEDFNRNYIEFGRNDLVIPPLKPDTTCDSFEKFIEKFIIDSEIEDPFLIYDATPTYIHIDNIVAVSMLYKNELYKNKIFYFGEKPLLLDKDQLVSIPSEDQMIIWCNFIELFSPAFLSLRSFLNENKDYLITKIRFWRVSTVGLEKIFSHKREGVTGGSLEDKMIHDIALASGILSQSDLDGFKSWIKLEPEKVISSAMIPSFMPASIYSIAGNMPLFMAINGKITDDLEECGWKWPSATTGGTLLPADASFILKTNIPRKEPVNELNPYVEVDFYSSWVGLSDFPALRTVIKQLSELNIENGFNELNWIHENTEKTEKPENPKNPNDIFTNYNIEEARVCLIQGVKKDNNLSRHFSIACNFLECKEKGIKPDVVLLFHDQPPKSLLLSEFNQEESLDRAFVTVIQNCLRIKSAEKLINNDYILTNHKLLLEARKSAFQRFYNTSVEADKCNNKFKDFLSWEVKNIRSQNHRF